MDRNEEKTLDELVSDVQQGVRRLAALGRTDLLLRAVGVQHLEQLRIEAARGTLSRLIITRDHRFLLEEGHREVLLSPVHKAVYLLFLRHPEGIEFKHLGDYRHELRDIYTPLANRLDLDKIEETVARLTNPLDNAINEKCSRIKAAFSGLMDEYRASYYIISSSTQRVIEGSSRVWFRRLKHISLPRELVVEET